MQRGIIAFLVATLIAGTLGYGWYVHDLALREGQEKQIAELNQRLAKLQADNQRLQADLTKVQDEESKLAANNELLRKALEQARVTGKIPRSLPYPPK